MTKVAATLAVCYQLLAACTDPGCIRNSECGTGFECKASQCVSLHPMDAGIRDAGLDAGDASADAGGATAVVDAAKKK